MKNSAPATLAKSLHTVTVIMRVARIFWEADPSQSTRQSITKALNALGYAGAADPYGLAEVARKQLDGEG